MSDAPHRVLEHVRAIRKDVADISIGMRGVNTRLGSVEVGLASLCREVAHVGETVVVMSVRMDRVDDRMLRIERRLELADASG